MRAPRVARCRARGGQRGRGRRPGGRARGCPRARRLSRPCGPARSLPRRPAPTAGRLRGFLRARGCSPLPGTGRTGPRARDGRTEPPPYRHPRAISSRPYARAAPRRGLSVHLSPAPACEFLEGGTGSLHLVTLGCPWPVGDRLGVRGTRGLGRAAAPRARARAPPAPPQGPPARPCRLGSRRVVGLQALTSADTQTSRGHAPPRCPQHGTHAGLAAPLPPAGAGRPCPVLGAPRAGSLGPPLWLPRHRGRNVDTE